MGGCKRLYNTIDVAECEKLEDTSIMSIGQNCLDLKTLNLQGCHMITDDVIENLVVACDSLETLGLTKCVSITDRTVENLAINSNSLRVLCLYGCDRVVKYGFLTQIGNPNKVAKYLHKLKRNLIRRKRNKRAKQRITCLN